MARREIKVLICDRHITETPATETRTITVDGNNYLLHLCLEHDQQYELDLLAWTRVATLVSTGAAATTDAWTPASWRTRLDDARERVLTTPLPAAPEPEPEPEPARRVAALHRGPFDGHLPRRAERWRVSIHAVRRCIERDIEEEHARWAAERPDETRPSKRDPNARIHRRGDVRVVVIPDDDDPVIVTVLPRGHDWSEDDDLEHAAAS